ncbi:DUF397 domain-containing protein [Streptomyces cylindrosporus]|uniref:DUF397 domain-containing protein n=1 Tax=Streptomyces cylindrosporus TaxID=2927583 RepID=A0ABS9YH85_9ACTN|nr:DUF397 domain-containing protein [Streptomyces cylindrosporus]MCI3276617.1 DUF397 domain-containing protein [Streptomyces cylindrosporus]
MTELAWFKSSYSDSSGGECLEVALSWRRSSHSDNTGGDCVEVATPSAPSPAIHIRDSKTPAAPHLTISPTTWSAFLADLHE